MLLTTSGFKPAKKQALKFLIEEHSSLMNWAFSPDLTCQVTHVIVASRSETMEATTDKLLAILTDRQSWPQLVVSDQWVEDCCKEGRVLDESQYKVLLIPLPPDQQQQQQELEDDREAGLTMRSVEGSSLIGDLLGSGRIGIDPELSEQDCEDLKGKLTAQGAQVADLTFGTAGIDLIICEPERSGYWVQEWGFLGHLLSHSSVQRFFRGSTTAPKISVLSTDCLKSLQQQNKALHQNALQAKHPDDAPVGLSEDRREVLKSIKASQGHSIIIVRPPPPLTLIPHYRWTIGEDPQTSDATEASQSEVVDMDTRLLHSCGVTILVPLDESGVLGLHPIEIKPLSSSYLTCWDLTSAVNGFYRQVIEEKEVIRLMRLHPGIRRLLQTKYLNRQTIQRTDLLGSRLAFGGLELRLRGGEAGGEVYELLLMK